MYLRFVDGLRDDDFELYHLLNNNDTTSVIMKLYRKIDNLEKRLENRD